MQNVRQHKVTKLKENASRLVGLGQLDAAFQGFLEAYSINSRDIEILISLGIISGMQDDYSGAEMYFTNALEIDPKSSVACYNFAIVQKYKGKLDSAVKYYRKAVFYEPTNATYYNNLANVLYELQDYDQAIEMYLHALVLSPDASDYNYNLGKAYKARGHRLQAVNAFIRAKDLRPDFSRALHELGSVYLSLGNIEKSRDAFNKALSINSQDQQSISGLANVYACEKKYQHSFDLLSPHVKDNPDISILLAFAGVASYIGREGEAFTLLESQLENKNLSVGAKAQIHFRLGHYYDNSGDYCVAFDHFKKGNSLRGSKIHQGNFREVVDDLIKSFSADYFASAPKLKKSSGLQPVFIVGMPRSGTTLIEQIIASHPDVHGAGELDNLPAFLAPALQAAGIISISPCSVKKIDKSFLEKISRNYLKSLKEIAPTASYITDKMPSNFLNLGYIKLLFPDAYIIHCRRNPLDTCLSCYFQDFLGHLTYANDLDSLAKYYRQYDRLMNHWENILDSNIIHIDYEPLLTDFEAECKRIIGFFGLEWNESCLDFYKGNRVIVTSSKDQVNKPLYLRSVNRWKNYETHILKIKKYLEY